MAWGIAGPEVVFFVALGQYASARRSVTRFARLGYSNWTLSHGFFADMGGILLQPRDSTPFLVNARQLVYLVQHRYIEYPQISSEAIEDKSKADTMTKFLTVLQASWLLVQLGGRAKERLATTTLELSSAAIVLCTFGTFVCWLHKPSDVQTCITLTTQASTAQILLDAGESAAKPYQDTPLDFVAKEAPTFTHDIRRILGMRCDNLERPLRCFPNDRMPVVFTLDKHAMNCVCLTYLAFHFIGWHFFFPSLLEHYLWRVSVLVVTGTYVTIGVFTIIVARVRFGSSRRYIQETSDPLEASEKQWKEAKPIFWWELATITFLTLAYAIARAAMIFEAFASLRKLPPGAYQTVELSQLFPHY